MMTAIFRFFTPLYLRCYFRDQVYIFLHYLLATFSLKLSIWFEAQALLMGDAYTSAANDEFAITTIQQRW